MQISEVSKGCGPRGCTRGLRGSAVPAARLVHSGFESFKSLCGTLDAPLPLHGSAPLSPRAAFDVACLAARLGPQALHNAGAQEARTEPLEGVRICAQHQITSFARCFEKESSGQKYRCN